MVVLLVVVSLLVSRRRVALIVAACLVAGIVTAGLESAREAALSAGSVPSGRVTLAGVAISDPRGSGADTSTLVDPHSIELGAAWYAWDGPLLLIRGPTTAIAGEHVAATGSIDPDPGEYRGVPSAASCRRRTFTGFGVPPTPCWRPAISSADECSDHSMPPPGILRVPCCPGSSSET